MKKIRKINVIGRCSWAFIIPKDAIKQLKLKRDSLLTYEIDGKSKSLIIRKVNK